MTNEEWIELFFSESYEKQINDMILEDIDYEVPRASIRNYIQQLLDIPYGEFVEYVKHHYKTKKLTTCDVPRCSILNDIDSYIDYFISENDRGISTDDFTDNFNSYYYNNKLGKARNIFHTLEILGICYEYFGLRYLNCLAYVHNSLPKQERNSLYARVLLRAPFFQHFFDSKEYNLHFELSKVQRTVSSPLFYICLSYIKILESEGFKNNIAVSVSEKFPFTQMSIKRNSRLYYFLDELDNLYSGVKKTKLYNDYLIHLSLCCYDEEYELIQIYRVKRDLRAYTKLMESLQLPVSAVVYFFCNKTNTFEDLFQEAQFGISDAINTYNLASNIPFQKYVRYMVFVHLAMYIKSYKYLITIPSSTYNSFIKLKRKHDIFCARNECELLNDDIITVVEDSLLLTSTDDFEERDHREAMVRRALNILKKREREILLNIYGIGTPELGLEQIGDKFGLTRERVRQICVKAIKKIRDTFSPAGYIIPSKVDKIKLEHDLSYIETLQSKNAQKKYANDKHSVEYYDSTNHPDYSKYVVTKSKPKRKVINPTYYKNYSSYKPYKKKEEPPKVHSDRPYINHVINKVCASDPNAISKYGKKTLRVLADITAGFNLKFLSINVGISRPRLISLLTGELKQWVVEDEQHIWYLKVKYDRIHKNTRLYKSVEPMESETRVLDHDELLESIMTQIDQ